LSARCGQCGYPKTGLSGTRCPECGSDAWIESGHVAALCFWLRSRWTRPPSRRMQIFTVALVGMWLLVVSAPGNPCYFFFGCLPTLGITFAWYIIVAFVLLDYCMRAVIAARNRVAGGNRHCTGTRRYIIRWVVLPICVCLVATGMVSQWPLRLRFQISQPLLEKAAEDFVAGGRKCTRSEFIGLMWCHRVNVGYGVVYFDTGARVELLDSPSGYVAVGLAYRPADPWPDKDTRLARGWYVYR